MLRRFERILRGIILGIISIYVSLILLFSLPPVQKILANWIANVLSEKLQTKVEIGNVYLGFLGRVIINDVVLCDHNGHDMLKVARLSGGLNYLQIMQGNMHFSTVQLFSPVVQLYRDSLNAAPNYQFLVDALSSDDEEETSVNLRINRLLLRHANISYDVKDAPYMAVSDSVNTSQTLDLNHLRISNMGMDLILKALTRDSVNLGIKRMYLSELNSGLSLTHLDLNVEANEREAVLSKFLLKTHHSTLRIDSLKAYYPEYQTDGTFFFTPFQLRATVTPSDFQGIFPILKNANTPLLLATRLSGDSKNIKIENLDIHNIMRSLTFSLNASLAFNDKEHRIGNFTPSSADGELTLRSMSDGLQQIAREIDIPSSILQSVVALGNIDYAGTFSYVPSVINSDGNIHTSAGHLDYSAVLALPDKDITNSSPHQASDFTTLSADIYAKDFNIGKVLGNENYGITNFDAYIQMQNSVVKTLHMNADVHSPALELLSAVQYSNNNGIHNLNLDGHIGKLNPHALELTTGFWNEKLQANLHANLTGSNIDNLAGNLNMHDIKWQTDTVTYRIDSLGINIDHQPDNSHISIAGNLMEAEIDGDIVLSTLPEQIKSMLHSHLPRLFPQKHIPHESVPNNLAYTVHVRPHAIFGHLLPNGCKIIAPVNVSGFINAEAGLFSLNALSDKIEYAGRHISKMSLKCDNTDEALTADLSAYSIHDESAAKVTLHAAAVDGEIDSNIGLRLLGNTNIDMDLNTSVSFVDSMGSMKTCISIDKSLLTINDTTWNISPANMYVFQQDVSCNNLVISSPSGSFISINGTASKNTNDSIIARLHDVQIEYILDAIDFTSVDLAGRTSGVIVIDDPLSDTPFLSAKLDVNDLLFEGGSMGHANINANWDSKRKSILLNAYMQRGAGSTMLNGYVSPANNDIRLDITAYKTNAEFLNGYLDDIFHPISGDITGQISVIGPLDNVNLLGEADVNLQLALLATNVPYTLQNQHISLKPNLMQFRDIELTDQYGNEAKVNGEITHVNLANFRYDFRVDFSKILAYDEKEFNEDNFYATVFADGTLTIRGRDGYPMYITANITPTAGSVFAYDSASPDAITSGNFIEWGEKLLPSPSPTDGEDSKSPAGTSDNISQTEDFSLIWLLDNENFPFVGDRGSYSFMADREHSGSSYTYRGDLYMDFNIDLTEACQIKLRMDNNDDGYITTYGHGNITAKYHNKGSLQLFGTYDIQRGNYRLYMQDLIYKDLTLQEGSSIEFNGAPFDANIHLICHHLVNAVPLSDLTATTAYAANNKVKVNCILDITGKLGNMAFSFDIDVPNVSDEIKQLIHSMINSEEEMNTQIIYLLALGRFYPSALSESSSENASSSAVNSIVSSTLSGQLNNIIGNLIGSDSNWTFGTGIITGERGWKDLDVEGTLSGKLFDDRLLINGNFGYRDNTLTNTGTIIGDFEVRWRIGKEGGNTYLKAYNLTNDRYFTKSTLNTQGVGFSYIRDFENWKNLFQKTKWKFVK